MGVDDFNPEERKMTTILREYLKSYDFFKTILEKRK